MNLEQRALRFQCQGSSLIGIVDVPERPLPRGVLMLADSAQYRVGSHRQFTLLSRVLAARGIPVMRFDRRGMGDSDGPLGDLDANADDIRAALKEFLNHAPEMQEIVLFGLGDAASAAALYAGGDERVRGLVLLNPDVGPAPEDGAALPPATLARLIGVGFWKKVAAGRSRGTGAPAASDSAAPAQQADGGASLPRRVADALAAFSGEVLVVLAGEDPVAREFSHLIARHQLPCRQVDIPHADHRFASREWRDDVATRSANWIMSW